MIKAASRVRRRIKALTQILFNREEHSGLRSYLIHGASWSFALNIGSTGLAFITSIILARTLGAKGYGTYAYALSLVGLLGVPATLGLPQLVLRNVAAYQVRSEWGLLRGLLRRADQTVLLASLGIGVIAFLVSLLYREHSTSIVVAFWFALLILPLGALNGLRASTLRGLGYVVWGQLSGSMIQPFSFLAIVIIAYILLGNYLDSLWAVGGQVGATAITLGFEIFMLMRCIPKAVNNASPVYDTRTWARSALPFLFIGGMQVINNQTDIVMLGALKGAEAVGIYRVATRAAQLVVFVLAAANVALQPTVAKLYAVKDIQRLQRVATQSARVVLVLSLPVAIALIAFGHWILLIFGRAFIGGATALAILSVGQLVNAGMGSVGLILNMTGHERETAKGVGIAAAVNVVLNAALIPLWGINGAATATATSLAVWNLILAIQVVRRLGIDPTAFGRIGLR